MLEALEPRIAPASVFNFTDVDGDKVKITSDVGTLTTANVKLSASSGPAQLYLLDLTAAEFKNAKITIVSTKAGDGDGYVNVGRISSPSHNLASVKVDGDLGSFIVGDIDPVKPGIDSFEARSFGAFGTSTQNPASASSPFATVVGGVATFKIVKNVVLATLDFQAGNGPSTVGLLDIGGSVDRALITVASDLDRLHIGGNLRGGVDDDTGRIAITGRLGGAHIDGSILGGQGERSGSLDVGKRAGAIFLGESLVGGSGDNSGSILLQDTGIKLDIGDNIEGGIGDNSGNFTSYDSVGKIVVNGYIVGDKGADSGAILSNLFDEGPDTDSVSIGRGIMGGSGDGAGRVFVYRASKVVVEGDIAGGAGPNSGNLTGAYGQATVRGDIMGGSGEYSGVAGGDHVGLARIEGSVIGGSGDHSGTVNWAELDRLEIEGDLRGASVNGADSLAESGTINAYEAGSIRIHGDIVAGSNGGTGTLTFSGGILIAHGADEVEIEGDVIGNTTNPAIIEIFPCNDNITVNRLRIGGSVFRADIMLGSEYDLIYSPDAIAGEVLVGGKWTASNLAVGVGAGGDGFYGTRDDSYGNGVERNPATLNLLVIAGGVFGTGSDGDHFGFAAQHIVKAKIKGVTLPLAIGPSNDDLHLLASTTDDVTLREAGIPPMG